jgi:UDPglucose--hexose-1-phosphate uridylyltransferase
MHELRKDPLLGRWVAVFSNSLPPDALNVSSESIENEPCILCSGKEAETPPEVAAIRAEGTAPDTAGWWTRAIPNIKPILETEGELGRKGIGMYDRMNSIGVNELIIESPEHDKNPEDLGAEQFRRVLELYKMRITEIEKDARIRYVLICKSSGRLAGATYSHPHSELIATPVIPRLIKGELDGAKQYYAYKERCIFCDIIEEELRMASRLITETENFVAFCPYAPKFPFEFWVMPKRHGCAFEEASPEEMEDLSQVMTSLIKKMRVMLKEPAYNYVIHTAPNRIPRRNHWHTLGDDFHWHIEVAPRLMRESGIQWGAGFYILTTSPEDAAKYYKEA